MTGVIVRYVATGLLAGVLAWSAKSCVGQRADNKAKQERIDEYEKRILRFESAAAANEKSTADFAKAIGENRQAAAALRNSLTELRGTTVGLRNTIAASAKGIPGASREAANEYAATCAAVLIDVAEAGERLAEGGAAIAEAADGHAADAKLKTCQPVK